MITQSTEKSIIQVSYKGLGLSQLDNLYVVIYVIGLSYHFVAIKTERSLSKRILA